MIACLLAAGCSYPIGFAVKSVITSQLSFLLLLGLSLALFLAIILVWCKRDNESSYEKNSKSKDHVSRTCAYCVVVARVLSFKWLKKLNIKLRKIWII